MSRTLPNSLRLQPGEPGAREAVHLPDWLPAWGERDGSSGEAGQRGMPGLGGSSKGCCWENGHRLPGGGVTCAKQGRCELFSSPCPGNCSCQCPLPRQELHHLPAQVWDAATPLPTSSFPCLHSLLCPLQLISCAARMERMGEAGRGCAAGANCN